MSLKQHVPDNNNNSYIALYPVKFTSSRRCIIMSTAARSKHRLPAYKVQCCFTSTVTVRSVRDGEPRASTSAFTQLLECFRVALRPQRPYGLLGTGTSPLLSYSS